MCQHCFCGCSWSTVGSTTGGSPGGVVSYGVCCKCGALTDPAYSFRPENLEGGAMTGSL